MCDNIVGEKTGRRAKMKIKAYAKINLFLDVVAKRENGFHDIESVMQTISLADDLDINVEHADNEPTLTVECDSDYAPSGEDNIVYRAARKYLDAADVKASVRIKLTKNIPSPAGLGGGSADAAATLRALNGMFNKLDSNRLLSIADSIGSDVSFCMCGGTQIALGKGERLESADFEMPDCFIVVACGRDKMPTPYAYRRLDEKYGDFASRAAEHTLESSKRSLGDLETMSASLYNIFEEVTSYECPSVNQIKDLMKENGAKGALMCGSGPAVFGIFGSEIKAKNVKRLLEGRGYFAAVGTPVKRYE